MQKKLTAKQVSAITQAFKNATTLEQQLIHLQQMQYADGSKVYDLTHWEQAIENIVEELCECIDESVLQHYKVF
tara:strand:- start:566 stop:787 length:222 start_codon:yes stop_codon:yes gene_type:complete